MCTSLTRLCGQPQSLPVYGDLPEPEDAKPLLSATAVLKLNGGLGTSMGLEKAKSLLPVKDGKTFLDLIAEQVRDSIHSAAAQA
jgi:UTP--glucose-1-phosphate uridylyltransferase